MITIWKFALEEKEQEIELPHDAWTILTVQTQNNKPYIWILLDTDKKEKQTIIVRTFETGQKFDLDGYYRYIGTYQLDKGSYIAHVFWQYKNDWY